MSDQKNAVSDRAREAGFETSDVSSRRVTLLLGLIGLCLIVTLPICVAIVWALKPQTIATLGGPTQAFGDNPRLLVKPREERLKVENAAERRLGAYAPTTDPNYAKIPIDRAMQLLAEQGWPDEATKEARR